MLQLLHIMEEWIATLENGGQINTIYTDFEKAFDKVPRHLLLKKLQSYNLNVHVIQWIRSFLCYRKQRVKINGCYSEWTDAISGIPQGILSLAQFYLLFTQMTYQKFVNSLSVSTFLQMMQSCLSMSSVTKIIKLYS